MSPVADPEDLDAATRLINSYALSDWVRITYSSHAHEQQGKRIICNDLVELTLRQGVVVGVRKEVVGNVLRYKYEVEFVDKYGCITVITAIAGPMHLIIVSTFTDVSD